MTKPYSSHRFIANCFNARNLKMEVKIFPKKSRGKGSQGKKIADDSQEPVDVFKDSKSEPKLVKRKTSSKGRVKKKVTLSADNNIISGDLDDSLELAKSISKTKAEEAEERRQVHATHTRIVTEYVLESTEKKSGGRSSKSVVIQDTPSAQKSKPATSNAKLKGCNPLALVGKVTPVEDNTGLLETTFVEDGVLMGVFPDEGICSVNLVLLLFLIGVTAINLVPKSLMQGQVCLRMISNS
nr:hypothetical protein [Tanacetum cinerariifolium]